MQVAEETNLEEERVSLFHHSNNNGKRKPQERFGKKQNSRGLLHYWKISYIYKPICNGLTAYRPRDKCNWPPIPLLKNQTHKTLKNIRLGSLSFSMVTPLTTL